jgi:hypothetical protein
VELERQLGGLLSLREIVNAMTLYVQGQASLEDLGKVVRRTFFRIQGGV